MKATDIPRVLERVAKLEAEAQRARGRMDTLRGLMQKEFNVTTATEARALLAKLRDEQAKDEAQLTQAMEAFSREYPDLVSA